MTFRIYVETLSGNQLVFRNVPSYDLKEGMVIFTDQMTNLKKAYPSSKCQIEEEGEVRK